MTPGVLAQSVMFVAIFYGITVVWERDLGLLNKLLCQIARAKGQTYTIKI
jgi:ABC-2 type transport system permease protein